MIRCFYHKAENVSFFLDSRNQTNKELRLMSAIEYARKEKCIKFLITNCYLKGEIFTHIYGGKTVDDAHRRQSRRRLSMDIVRKIKRAIQQYQNHIYKPYYKRHVLAGVQLAPAEPHQLECRLPNQHGDKLTGWTILGLTSSSSKIFYSSLKRPHQL
jgi:hypothetical protein